MIHVWLIVPKAKLIPSNLVAAVQTVKVNDQTLALGPDGQKSWNVLKYHQLSHALSHIQRKGASLHHSSRPWEKCHDPLRQIYLITNKKSVGKQVSWTDNLPMCSAC
jgi:hypothetical protein